MARAKAEAVFQLIRNACTMHEAKNFLKEKNLSFSAVTWKDLFEKRVLPAIDVGTLTLTDLHNFLREVEEHGRQHVFLFRCVGDRKTVMLGAKRISDITKEQGLEEIALAPLAVMLPNRPQLVDIRWDTCSHGGQVYKALVIKQVETRSTFQFVGQVVDPITGFITKRYEPVKSRAINLARMHSDGTLEIRLASHKNSTQYTETLAAFQSAISPWLPLGEFEELSLNVAKAACLNKREELSSLIRHGGHTLRNDSGTTLTARSSSPSDDVLADDAAEKSLDSFLETDGWSESAQIYFKISSADEKREVLVLMSSATNEFAIPYNCSNKDYEYVFGQIRTLNT